MMAAVRGILVGWNRVVPGKEVQAVALFGEAMAYWSGQQQAGAIESFEPVFLSPHGGDLNGFFLIRGEPGKLAELLETDDYLALEQKGSNLLEGHGVIPATFGEGISRRMSIYQKVTSGG
jgi:hypothetical protein